MMSNNCSHGDQTQPSLLLFPFLWLLEHFKAFAEAQTSVLRISNFLSLSPSIHLPALWEGIDSPLGREDVSPCMDWIDNVWLNIALRQEVGGESIFRSVYSAVTRTLPQLNDQMEVRDEWGWGWGRGVIGGLWALSYWKITALSGIVKRKKRGGWGLCLLSSK